MLELLNFSVYTPDQRFLEILNRSLAAIPVILAVLLARLVLKELPRRLTVVLWLIVFFRLLIPFTLESSAGILPQEEIISPSAAAGEDLPLSRTFYTARRIAEDAINDELDPLYIIKTPDEIYYFSPSEFLLICCGHIWFIGMAAMALHSVYAFFQLKKRLIGAMKWKDNVWLCDGIDTPFVLGVLQPKIYLPSGLSDSDRAAILAHEQTHIRHLDPAMKLLAWMGLCLHWFNPLVWGSFHLMVEDMEAACDEAVTADLSKEARADYADTLLRLSTGKRAHATTPLAFGEGDPQGRIRRIFHFRRPTKALVTLAAASVVILSFFLVTENSKEPHLLGGGYQVSEILYVAPISDPRPLSVADTPDFCITGDYHLLYTHKEQVLNVMDFAPVEQWENLGQLQSYPLDHSELMDMLPVDDSWTSSWRPGRITDAWWLQSGDEANTFFLLFQTSAGETLLAIGYEDLSERGQGASDDTSIHYLFQMTPPHAVVYRNPDPYFQLDLYQTLGTEVEVFQSSSNASQNWSLCGFTMDGGIGFASYQWVDSYHKLIDIQFYPADELEYLQLRIPGCYITPDPITSVPRDDLEREVFSSETYDAVFIFNEEVAEVKRIVTAEVGTVVSEDTHHLENVMGEPQLLKFSWAQEEGHNPCSVSYHFYDIDGNEMT